MARLGDVELSEHAIVGDLATVLDHGPQPRLVPAFLCEDDPVPWRGDRELPGHRVAAGVFQDLRIRRIRVDAAESVPMLLDVCVTDHDRIKRERYPRRVGPGRASKSSEPSLSCAQARRPGQTVYRFGHLRPFPGSAQAGEDLHLPGSWPRLPAGTHCQDTAAYRRPLRVDHRAASRTDPDHTTKTAPSTAP